MKQYELPYNFAYDFLAKLSRKPQLFSYIKCIYLPAYKEDAVNSRIDIYDRDEYPKTYEEYVIRLKALQQLGIPLCILLQRETTIEVAEKYYDLGIRMFILGDDEIAKDMRHRHPKVQLILTVTRALNEDQIRSGDFSMYDEIVLFFWFNRHIDALKSLPDKNKYVLIPNNDCYYDCRWHDQHWFAKTVEEERTATEKCRQCMQTIRDTTYIEPENLSYFDPYISSYKLVDRLFPTDRILEDLERYVSRNAGAQPREEDFYNVTD